MISRRALVLAASSLVLALCSSCANVTGANDGDDEANGNDLQEAREHITQDNVVGVYLFSLDGRSLAEIDQADFEEVVGALSNLDSKTSEEPAVVPEGGFSGGRERMFFVVLDSSATLAVGENGTEAIYDSVLYQSSYDACQEVSDLYTKLLETTLF